MKIIYILSSFILFSASVILNVPDFNKKVDFVKIEDLDKCTIVEADKPPKFNYFTDVNMTTKERNFIKRFYKVAQGEQIRFNIPSSISLAQGILESASGTSNLAIKNNNFFGIKCFSKKCRIGHCSNFTDDSHKDFFVKYKTAWLSWRAHSTLLNKAHYNNLHKLSITDYKSWAWGLQYKGYATSKTYAKKLISIIEKLKLYHFDQINMSNKYVK